MKTRAERWADIPGVPRYRVSSFGRIQSQIGWRGRPAKPSDPWRDIRPFAAGKGYRMVSLRVSGEDVREYVHRLVLLAFVGPCPAGMEARHTNDNDRGNNRLDNLCWGTPTQNQGDRRKHGTHIQGSAVPWAKLTETDVAEMRDMRRRGIPRATIAARFRITPNRVTKITLGGYGMWDHIPVTDREAVRRAGYGGVRFKKAAEVAKGR